MATKAPLPKRAYSVTAAAVAAFLVSACAQEPTGSKDGSAELRVQASTAGTAIATIVVTVTASDIATPLAFNLTVQGGVASGTIVIPAGSGRLITVRAYNAASIETHRGSVTIDVVEGNNPTVTVVLDPLVGNKPIVVQVGSFTILMSPQADTLTIGDTVRFRATIIDARGDTVRSSAVWATLTPWIVTVDTSGLVTAVGAGSGEIVATYAGFGAAAQIEVKGSPSLIVFTSVEPTGSDRGGPEGEIYTVLSDGSNLTRLTDDRLLDGAPALSPNGSMIAWGSRRDDFFQFQDIWVMPVSGASRTNLTLDHSVIHDRPAWSFDGSRIAFYGTRDLHPLPEGREIYVMNADGSGQTRVTNNLFWDDDPNWSPDGRIAFRSIRTGESDIYVINPDGTNEVRLTTIGARSPSWSPDGQRMAFVSGRDGNDEIYVIRADGSGATRLTFNLAYDDTPTWSPDGSQIAFGSNRDGDPGQIYVMNADGSQPRRITNLPTPSGGSRWRN